MSTLEQILLTEASKRYNHLIKKYDNFNSLRIIKEEFNLSEDEENKVKELISNNTQDEEVIKSPEDYIIYFSSSEELDDSLGRLMYNRIPWESQSNESIKFKTQEDMNKAIKLLNKFDFISSTNDVKATITFDDLSDYEKVLNFIKKSDMFIVKNNKEIYDSSSRTEEYYAINKKIKNTLDPEVDTKISIRQKF